LLFVSENVQTCSPSEFLILSEEGFNYLKQMFAVFDMNNDSLLDDSDVNMAFELTPVNLFLQLQGDSEHHYTSMAETTDGKLTLNGWLSLWCLIGMQNPYSVLRSFYYWGNKDLQNMFVKTLYVIGLVCFCYNTVM